MSIKKIICFRSTITVKYFRKSQWSRLKKLWLIVRIAKVFSLSTSGQNELNCCTSSINLLTSSIFLSLDWFRFRNNKMLRQRYSLVIVFTASKAFHILTAIPLRRLNLNTRSIMFSLKYQRRITNLNMWTLIGKATITLSCISKGFQRRNKSTFNISCTMLLRRKASISQESGM